MYAFPSADALKPCVGQILEIISLGPFQVTFIFNGMSLSIESSLTHKEPDGTAWDYSCRAEDGPPLLLHRLIGRKIISVIRDDWRLLLAFDDASTLMLHSVEGGYESGNIGFADEHKTFFVF